jgi:O-antigen/teichoic acid export membrane protein
LRKDLLLIFAIVSVIGVVEILVITFFGVSLFKIVFGEMWGFSGEISKILVWAYALNFFVASFSAIFISMNRIKLLSVWQIIYFISILSLILFRNSAFLYFLNVYVIIEVSCYIVMIIMMLSIVVTYEKKVKTMMLN